MICERLGTKRTIGLGGLLCTIGMFIASFNVDSILMLWICYGLLFGLGGSLCYSPSLSILGKYFKRHLSKACGFVETGAPLFGAVTSAIISRELSNNNLQLALWTLGGVSTLPMVTSLIYGKRTSLSTEPDLKITKHWFNKAIWKNKKYVIWIICSMLGQLGFYAPFAHIAKFSLVNFPDADPNNAILCISIASIFGRLVAGFIGDLRLCKGTTFQQFLTISFGFAILVISFFKIPYQIFLLMAAAFGLLDGAVIALNNLIAVELCGVENSNQALGFLLGSMSPALIAGPPLVGMLFDHSGDFTLGFLISSLLVITGGLGYFLMRLVKDEEMPADEESPLLFDGGLLPKKESYETLL